MSHPYYGLNELREMFLRYFEQKNGHVTQMSVGEIPVERRSGKGQLLVSVLLDDVVVYAGTTE